MKLERLSEQHLNPLIKFEHDNRAWFERFIESRGNDFYQHSSISQHLSNCLQEYHAGTHYPAVVIDHQQIIARVNLKNIDLSLREAEIGYRVAEKYAGRGVISQAVNEIILLAKNELALNRLKALVLENNPASARVLEKQGFVKVKNDAGFFMHAGKKLRCSEYQLSLVDFCIHSLG